MNRRERTRCELCGHVWDTAPTIVKDGLGRYRPIVRCRDRRACEARESRPLLVVVG